MRWCPRLAQGNQKAVGSGGDIAINRRPHGEHYALALDALAFDFFALPVYASPLGASDLASLSSFETSSGCAPRPELAKRLRPMPFFL